MSTTAVPRVKSYIWWIAWRNLNSRHRRAGLSFMTVVSIVGVAIGVAALIIVLSVMGGFESDLLAKMQRGEPHLELMNKHNAMAGLPLDAYPVEDLKRLFPEATDVQPFTQADVVLKQNRHITSAILFGVDHTRTAHLWGFGDAMIEGELAAVGQMHRSTVGGNQSLPGIALGDKLSEQLGAEVGDTINVLSPSAGVTQALSGGTVSHQFVVIGKFSTDLAQYDAKWAVVSLAQGRKFMADYDETLDEENYVSGIALNIKDPMRIDETMSRVFGDKDQPGTAATILKGADQLAPLTWKQTNKSLLFALKLEKFAMGSILMLIVVVAAFSISGTMMMTVFHRRGQVSLLRSLGMSRRDVARLFLGHGFTIGTIGILAGLLLGLAVCALISSFQFIKLPAGVYQLKLLPCRWLWGDYAIICVIAWLFSLAASLYPALTAAKQDPGQGLRYL